MHNLSNWQRIIFAYICSMWSVMLQVDKAQHFLCHKWIVGHACYVTCDISGPMVMLHVDCIVQTLCYNWFCVTCDLNTVMLHLRLIWDLAMLCYNWIFVTHFMLHLTISLSLKRVTLNITTKSYLRVKHSLVFLSSNFYFTTINHC